MIGRATLRKLWSFSDTNLSTREKFLLALPGPAASLSSVMVHNVYIKMYTDVIGLDPSYVAMIYFWFNIWNSLNDPIFGVLLDRMPYLPNRGKYLYVMRVTVPFIILSLVGLLLTDPDWSQQKMFLLLLAQLFVFDTAFTIFSLSYRCYYLLAAPSKEERVDLQVMTGYLANFFSFFATVIPSFLLVGATVQQRPTIVMVLMGVITLNSLVYIVSMWKLKDPPEMYEYEENQLHTLKFKTLWPDVKSIVRMRAFWSWFFFSLTAFAPSGIYFTALLYFMDHVIHATGTTTTVVDVAPMLVVFAVYPVLGSIIKRVGGRTGIFLGMLPYMGGLAMLYFAQTWVHALGAYVFIMTGKYLSETAFNPLSAAIIDENEMITGTRKTGLFAAVFAILGAPAAGLQLVIYMWIIKHYGYDVDLQTQTESAPHGIRIATALVPLGFCLIGTIPLAMFPYNRRKEQQLSEFSQRRGDFDSVTEG